MPIWTGTDRLCVGTRTVCVGYSVQDRFATYSLAAASSTSGFVVAYALWHWTLSGCQRTSFLE